MKASRGWNKRKLVLARNISMAYPKMSGKKQVEL